MHLCNLLISALSNVSRTGRTVNDNDKKFLRLVLSFWCGWSATAVEHMGDPGFCYIQHRWPHLDLMPILDDMTYEEEVRWMPKYISCERATIILLASKNRYYIYHIQDDDLLDAGSTLEEVYKRLRKAHAYNLRLPTVKPFKKTYPDNYFYFPDYERDRTLTFEVKPFHPNPNELEDSDGDEEDDEDEETDPVGVLEGEQT
jgi:hypothetical protein